MAIKDWSFSLREVSKYLPPERHVTQLAKLIGHLTSSREHSGSLLGSKNAFRQPSKGHFALDSLSIC